MKKLLSLLLALAMVFSLAACSGGNDNPGGGGGDNPGGGGGSEEPYEASVQFVGLFEENNNIANVEAALNEITVPAINVKVKIVPVFIGDLPTTTALAVGTDEKLDIVTVGLTSSITDMVKNDLLLPLDDLLAEHGQGALAVTKNVAEAQKINGKTYGVSGYPFAAIAGGFVYNKTMADEWGIDMHDEMTLEDLAAAGAILKEHGVSLTTFGNSSQCNYKFFYGGDLYGSSGEYGGILHPAESTEIVNIYGSKEMRDYFKAVKNWKDAGYLPAGQLTDSTSVQEYFSQQKIFGTSTAYTVDQIGAWQSASFETGIVRMGDATISTGSVTEFMLGIAANCKRPDKAMQLINLIYTNADVANLLQYGVEGTDYVAVEGTKNVITYEGTPNDTHNSYYSPFIQFGSRLERKIVSPLTDSYYDEVQAFENSALKSLAFGYSFDPSGFSAESGAVNNVLAERLPALNAGEVDDVDAAVDALVAAMENAGINNIITANQEQLNTFLGK